MFERVPIREGPVREVWWKRGSNVRGVSDEGRLLVRDESLWFFDLPKSFGTSLSYLGGWSVLGVERLGDVPRAGGSLDSRDDGRVPTAGPGPVDMGQGVHIENAGGVIDGHPRHLRH